ncbi:MAG: type II toxin-antitoxin system prevent-host-death family antitoxin [Armatimonadota bacterium]|nr:type II toxin-antitoxin system prevent-host-death family antitoxin [Armatimonadota bacterium]
MKVVTARELKNRTSEVLRRVRAGESVVVTLRGVPVARVVPESPSRLRGPESKTRSWRDVISAVAGKYRGVGTVKAFLREKATEIAGER